MRQHLSKIQQNDKCFDLQQAFLKHVIHQNSLDTCFLPAMRPGSVRCGVLKITRMDWLLYLSNKIVVPKTVFQLRYSDYFIQWNLSITDTLGPDISGYFLLKYRGLPLSEVKNVLVTPFGTKIFVLIMEVFSNESLIRRAY